MPRADSSITAHCQNFMLGEPLPLPPSCQGCYNRSIKGGTVPGRVSLCPVTQADTSVPIRAPWGLGACPAIGARGLLAWGGPALAGGTAPLEKEVDKGLGAVQSWGSPPCPLSLWFLLLPLLLCGQRRGCWSGEVREWHPKFCLGVENFRGLEGLLGDTDWKRVLLWGAVDHQVPWDWALGCLASPRDKVGSMWGYRIPRGPG